MNYNRRPQLAFALIVFLGLIFNSCKTQKKIPFNGFQNEFFGIKGLQCLETKNPDAIDSQVGTVDCGTISFTYDYGKFGYPGPITPKEEFRRSFDTYHHIKFFENRMIDAKVYKIFLDSVQVINVRRKKATDKLFFKCEPCNTTAEITFKGDTYFYPLTLSENQLNQRGYSCSFQEKEDFIYKYFQEIDAFSGLYIAPKKNRNKNKNTLSLLVSDTTLSKEEVDNILKNVYLIK